MKKQNKKEYIKYYKKLIKKAYLYKQAIKENEKKYSFEEDEFLDYFLDGLYERYSFFIGSAELIYNEYESIFRSDLKEDLKVIK